MNATWTLTKMRMRLAARNRTFLFFSLMMPMLFLVGIVFFLGRRGGSLGAFALGDLLTVTVMGSFFGLSMQLVSFREQGILRRFRLAPVGPGPMLASSILSNYALALPTLLIEILVCRWALHLESWGNPWAIFLLITFGSAAFSCFGLIIASVTNTTQETQIINQLIWMFFLFLSGATIPITVLPHWMQRCVLFTPATYLATGLESATTGQIAWADLLTDVVALGLGLYVSFEISRRLFRWEPETKVTGRAKLWVVAALIPFFLFGSYENAYGHLLTRVDTNFRLLVNAEHQFPSTPAENQDSPQLSSPR
jgi:ABC-2 type transport system permease protein